jgi:uncharacterized membrane protein
MQSHSYWTRTTRLEEWARDTVARIHTALDRFSRRVAGVAPDKWFLVGFVILFLLFFFVLLVQPSGVGRGGR